MATDDSKDRYQALVVPDGRISIWADETTVAATGHHVGQPVAASENTGRMTLRALRRTRVADVADITVQTFRGGYPAPTTSASPANFRWKYSDDADTLFRGWDEPRDIVGWHPLSYQDVSSAEYHHLPDITTTHQGTAIVAYVVEDYGHDKSIVVRRLVEGTWSDPIEVATGLDTGSAWAPKLLVRDDAGVIDLHYGGRIAVSLDDGLTWATGDTGVSGRGYEGVAMAYSRGQAVMFRDNAQYASTDGGYTWEQVTSVVYDAVDVVGTDTGFHVVAWVTDSTEKLKHWKLGDAFDPISASTGDEVVDLGGVGSSDYELALALADDGTLYAFHDRNGEYVVAGSADDGETWFDTHTGAGGVADGWWTDSNRGPEGIRATWHHGRAIVAHQWYASAGDEEDSIAVAYFGGWIVGPDCDFTTNVHWLPFDLPDASSDWTDGSSGITPRLDEPGCLEVGNTASAGIGLWYYAGTLPGPGVVSAYAGIWGRFTCSCTSDLASAPGHSQSNLVLVRLSDGSTETYEARITISSDTIRVYERDGSASWNELGSLSVDGTAYLQVWWAMFGDEIRVFCRADDACEDQVWTEVASGTMTEISAHDTTSYLMFRGQVDANETCRWKEFHVAVQTSPSQDIGTQDIIDAVLPYNHSAKSVAAAGAYVAGELVLTADGGPASPHDAWEVSSDYDTRVAHVLDDRPRLPWVGVPAGAAEYLALQYATANEVYGADVVGIPLFNSTLSAVTVETYQVGAGWGGAAAVDLTIAVGAWARHGHTIVANGSGVDLLVRMSEFDGAHFSPGAGTHAAGLDAVRISKTHEGKWTNGTTRRAVLELDPDADLSGWPTSGAAGFIIPRNALILYTFGGGQRSALRLTLDSSGSYVKPPSTGWQVGAMPVGPLVAHPEDQSWGRSWEVRAGTSMTQTRDRTRRTRVDAPTRREFEVSWADGVDTLNASVDADDPGYHYVELASSDPIALTRTTPWQVQGVLERVQGQNRTVTYVPRIEAWEGDAVVLNRRHQLAQVRLDGAVRLETAQGDEGVDEVVRVALMSMTEEV